MILDIKVPRDLEQRWNSWAERTFAKRAHLKSAPIASYFNESKLKLIISSLELGKLSPIDFASTYSLDALRYNEKVYIHPETMRRFLRSKFKEFKIPSGLVDACKSQLQKVA